MFAAGTDTSSTVLGWAMAELMNHPEEMRRLQAEVRGAIAGKDAGRRDVTEDHLDGMPYLRAVISETMRLHAPAPLLIPRETTEDTELLGHRVPARTRVVINAWAIDRDPAAWERRAGPVRRRPGRATGGVQLQQGGGGAGLQVRAVRRREERVPWRRVRRADRRARSRQLGVSLRLGRADGARRRRRRERGVRSLCPAQDAVDPRRQTMARTNLTKWTGLGALDKCIHAYQYCASRARCVFCVTVW